MKKFITRTLLSVALMTSLILISNVAHAAVSEITGVKLNYIGANGLEFQFSFSEPLEGDSTQHEYNKGAFTFNAISDFFEITLGDDKKTLSYSYSSMPDNVTVAADLSLIKEDLKFYSNYQGGISDEAKIQFDNLFLPVNNISVSTMKSITVSAKKGSDQKIKEIRFDIALNKILTWRELGKDNSQLHKLVKMGGTYVTVNVSMSDLNSGNKNLKIIYVGNVESATMTMDLGDLRHSLTQVFSNFYPFTFNGFRDQFDALALPILKLSTMESIQSSTFTSAGIEYEKLSMTFNEDLIWKEGYGYDMNCSSSNCQVVKADGVYIDVALSTDQVDDKKKLILTYSIENSPTITMSLVDLKAYLRKTLYSFKGGLTDAVKAQYNSLELSKSAALQEQEKSIQAEKDAKVHAQAAHEASEIAKAAITIAISFEAKNNAIEAANKTQASADDVSATDIDRKKSATDNAKQAKEDAESAKLAFDTLYEAKAIKGYWRFPVIKDLNYVTDKYNYVGKTDDKGMYKCQNSEVVSFSVGHIEVATISCPGFGRLARTITLFNMP